MMNTQINSMTTPIHHQSGAVLIVSMMMLMVLTILGLTTMNTVTMEERMAGNYLDHNTAFQAAEAGLRDAEDLVLNMDFVEELVPTDDGSSSVWEDGKLSATPEDESAAWWASKGIEYGTSGANEITTSNADPYYVIEWTDAVKPDLETMNTEITKYVRITVRAVGGSDNAVSVLQTSYARK